MKPLQLLFRRPDRLVSRLKTMLYSWRFIEQVGGQLVMFWPGLDHRYPDERIGYSPRLIFDLPRFEAEGGGERLRFRETEEVLPAEAIALDGPDCATLTRTGFPRAMFAGGGIFRQSRPHRHRFADEPADPTLMLTSVRRLFRSLPVHPMVKAARASFYARHGLAPGEFEAIHVRRGDILDLLGAELSRGRPRRLPPVRLDKLLGYFITRTAPDDFYRAGVAQAIARGRPIVFTSDAPEAFADFAPMFGCAPVINLATLAAPTLIQKAFADFLVLADAAHVIGTSSNFCSFAAEIGQAPFLNVAGSGTFDLVTQMFSDQILAGTDVDAALAELALQRLETLYGDFARRRAASGRAQSAAAARGTQALSPCRSGRRK